MITVSPRLEVAEAAYDALWNLARTLDGQGDHENAQVAYDVIGLLFVENG